jgi:hypothetical protein
MTRHHHCAHGIEDRTVGGDVDHLPAKASARTRDGVAVTTSLIGLYVIVVTATIVALAAMSAIGSHLATADAWVHAGVVAVFAVVLTLRLRAANWGRRRASLAVGIIAGVLLAVNVIEAAIHDLFPSGMRIEMIGIAALMAATLASVIRSRADASDPVALAALSASASRRHGATGPIRSNDTTPTHSRRRRCDRQPAVLVRPDGQVAWVAGDETSAGSARADHLGCVAKPHALLRDEQGFSNAP